MAIVNKIIQSSVVDGPGNRAAVFLQKCNFKCSYCHNPETIGQCVQCGACVEKCPAKALSLKDGKIVWDEDKCCECDTCIHVCPHMSSPRVKDYTAEQIMEQIAPDLPYIRGITVSGGECTLQRDFLAELFLLAKQQGLSTLIDSNGSYDFSQDAELMNVCDGVMLDVKAFDCDAHKKLTGMSNEQVLKNAVYLAEHGKLEEIRTVIVPDQLPNEDTVFQITKLLKPYLDKKQIRYKIIAYRQFGVRSPYDQIFRTPSSNEMMKYKKIAEDNGFENIILI